MYTLRILYVFVAKIDIILETTKKKE